MNNFILHTLSLVDVLSCVKILFNEKYCRKRHCQWMVVHHSVFGVSSVREIVIALHQNCDVIIRCGLVENAFSALCAHMENHPALLPVVVE